jgi:hypothetical protein
MIDDRIKKIKTFARLCIFDENIIKEAKLEESHHTKLNSLSLSKILKTST